MTPFSRRTRPALLAIAAIGLALAAGCAAPAAPEAADAAPGSTDSPTPTSTPTLPPDPSGYVPFGTDLSVAEAQARVEAEGLTDEVVGYRFESHSSVGEFFLTPTQSAEDFEIYYEVEHGEGPRIVGYILLVEP